MSRQPTRGYAFIKVAYICFLIAVVIIALVLLFRQHKDTLKPAAPTAPRLKLSTLTSTERQALTFISGQPLPSMGAGYTLLFQTPAGAPGTPETDYITAESQQQILSDVKGICKDFSFTTNRTTGGADIVSPAKSLLVETQQCYDADYSWSFDIEDASALTYPEYNQLAGAAAANTIAGHVKIAALGKQPASETWVNIQSLGPPVSNCKKSGVCDAPSTSPAVKQ